MDLRRNTLRVRSRNDLWSDWLMWQSVAVNLRALDRADREFLRQFYHNLSRRFIARPSFVDKNPIASVAFFLYLRDAIFK